MKRSKAKQHKVKLDNHKQRIYAFTFVALFAVAGILALVFTRAATVATLNLSTTSASPAIGEEFTVRITENTGTAQTNGVQANLTYDTSKLAFVSIDASDASDPFEIPAQATGSNGVVKIGRASIAPHSGVQFVADVKFRAIASGTSAIAFGANSTIASYPPPATNILTGTTGVTITVRDTTPPGAPTAISSPTQTLTSVGLSWPAARDNVAVTGYHVYRNGVRVTSVVATSYTDNGLTPGTAYTYTVAAYDAAGNASPQTAALRVSTKPDTVAPSVPTGIKASTATLTNITVTWTAASDNVGIKGYNVYRNGVKVGTANTTSYVDNGLTPGTAYKYTISAFDAVNNTSAQSTAVSLSTQADTTAPAVPTGLTATATSTTSISLRWNAATDNVGVKGYKVYRNGILIADVATTTYVNTGLAANVTYRYTVAAYDTKGNTSAQSPVVNGIVKLRDGDVNGDGAVNIFDVSIMSENWDLSGAAATRDKGDLNDDNVINIFDLVIVAYNWDK